MRWKGGWAEGYAKQREIVRMVLTLKLTHSESESEWTVLTQHETSTRMEH